MGLKIGAASHSISEKYLEPKDQEPLRYAFLNREALVVLLKHAGEIAELEKPVGDQKTFILPLCDNSLCDNLNETELGEEAVQVLLKWV